MALLAPEDHARIVRELAGELSTRRVNININRDEAVLAVAEIDQFIEDSLAAINNAFPEPARSELPVALKIEIYVRVMREKF